MSKIIDLSADDARAHFMKGGCYFRDDIPNYISFEPVLKSVADALGENSYRDVLVEDKKKRPENLPGVNYSFTANKDGRFAWRPYELMHPVIYVSLVNLMTDADNWKLIQDRFQDFADGSVECCSAPVYAIDGQSDTAAQVMSWWIEFEQKSLVLSLEFTHLLHSDVTDCYGSLYTHSIAWALHGLEEAKEKKTDRNLLGNLIDKHIQNSRFGQTNGIAQGSVLMDMVAELVLGFVDLQITKKIGDNQAIRVLRYRDDYRIFAKNDREAHEALKVISDCLRTVGMKLGNAKTQMSENVVEGSIKPDKLAGIELRDMDIANAKTLQKQLLRLHSFARRYPNSGALRRLAAGIHEKVINLKELPNDVDVLVAIVADIAVISPQAFPALAGILSKFLALLEGGAKSKLWEKVLRKIENVPHNGYLEMWLQRITKSGGVDAPFESDESICKIVNCEDASLWQNEWIHPTDHAAVLAALDASKIVVNDPNSLPAVIGPTEIQLFAKNAYSY